MRIYNYPCQFIFCLQLLMFLICPHPVSAASGVIAAADGDGTIRMLWEPAENFFPDKGWRLLRISDSQVVGQWTPVSRLADLTKINPAKAKSTDTLIQGLATTGKESERETALGLLSLASMTEFNLAQALGLGCTITAEKGNHRYRLELLDGMGQPLDVLWESEEIDGWIVTPLPSPPTDFTAKSTSRGVSLFWQQTEEATIPVTSYIIQRKTNDSNWQAVNNNPLLIMTDEESATPASLFIDGRAPLETDITYRVQGIDLLGRTSPFLTTNVFHMDDEALFPPTGFSAENATNTIKLTWNKHANPFTAGYLIERSTGISGRYLPITPKGLPRDTTGFKDTDVMGGLNYYYRIRSIGPRGDLGDPSPLLATTPLTDGPPSPPVKLAAEINPIKILLTWQAAGKIPTTGYVIERKSADTARWTRINSDIHPSTSYEDMFSIASLGSYHYRVISVGMDYQNSKPSKKIKVTLPGHREVPKPHLKKIASQNSVVSLSFKATGDTSRTSQLLVVRGNTLTDPGLIIGQPLSGSKTSFEDKMVRPGEDYWYGLIAQDKDGNRSELSDKLFIRVAAKAVPQPDKPDCSFDRKPFNHVTIRFKIPPNYLLTTILRKEENQERWTTIADNIRGTDEVIDSAPPRSGTVSYAVLYKTENGISGLPSKLDTVEIDN